MPRAKWIRRRIGKIANNGQTEAIARCTFVRPNAALHNGLAHGRLYAGAVVINGDPAGPPSFEQVSLTRARAHLQALSSVWKSYLVLPLAAGIVWAATPAFEVASIKPAQPVSPMEIMHGNVLVGMKIDGARVEIASLTLMDLIRIAYEVKPYQMTASEQVKGGERWDIQAKLPEGSRPSQIPAMLQALLAERFKIAVHRETKEHPAYDW